MILLLFLIIVITFIGLVLYFSRQVIYPQVLTHQHVRTHELEKNLYDPTMFDAYSVEDVELTSYFGYTLRGKLILQEQTDKFTILCHGITSNYEDMYKYSKLFLDRGYSILMYDQRNHGLSDRNFTSLGFFEKKDAKKCVDYLMKRFNEPKVGVFGVSMGAATVMQLATIDDRLIFCIEDCGYSDAERLLKYRALEDHNALIAQLLKPSDFYTKLFYKFSYRDASVIHTINKIKCPVLFIHGQEDDYVPYYMVNELFEAFNGEKQLLVIEEARHANSINTDKEKYTDGVNHFMNTYNL